MIIAGETIELRAEFKDANGNYSSPPGVEIEIKAPGEDTITASVSEQSEGIFVYEYELGLPGGYNYLFRTSDGAKEQKRFIAQRKIT